MREEHKTVFISYRRNVASFIARSIFLDLRAHDYDVFMDVESIDSGTFDTIILNQIEARAHFILILTPGTVERFDEPGDWLRREIEHAMQTGRNIVPMIVNEFKFNDETRKCLTGELAELPRYNGLNVPHDYFDAAMERLRTRFLKQSVTGKIKPTPPVEQPVVKQKIEEVAAQPAPTTEELSAEEYFSRAFEKRSSGDNDGAIKDYTEAIRLNPRLAEAYSDRGTAHAENGDLSGALADFDEAIRLNPQYAEAYYNRGIARMDNGDVSEAIDDYDEAIRLNPQYAEAYYNRGIARRANGDLSGVIDDYDEAIRLNPQYAFAYNNRGLAHSDNGNLSGALADYDEAIWLNPQYATAYSNRGEVYFSLSKFVEALSDFQQANTFLPADNYVLAGLAITQNALGQKAEAKRLWKALVAQDERYRDAEWVGKELNWRPELVEAARKLIGEL